MGFKDTDYVASELCFIFTWHESNTFSTHLIMYFSSCSSHQNNLLLRPLWHITATIVAPPVKTVAHQCTRPFIFPYSYSYTSDRKTKCLTVLPADTLKFQQYKNEILGQILHTGPLNSEAVKPPLDYTAFFDYPPVHTGAVCPHSGGQWRVLAWGSPKGPSSASGWRVAAVVACPGREVPSPWSEASPWEAAVRGADAGSVCSLGTDLWAGRGHKTFQPLHRLPTFLQDIIILSQKWASINKYRHYVVILG